MRARSRLARVRPRLFAWPAKKVLETARHPNGSLLRTFSTTSSLVCLSITIEFCASSDNMVKRVTLVDPPPQDHFKAPIENVLDLTPVVDLGPV